MVRAVFFGMSGAYSALALRALAEHANAPAYGAERIAIIAAILPSFEHERGLSVRPAEPPFRWTRWEDSATGRTLPARRSIALPQLGDSWGVAGARTPRQVARQHGIPLLEVAGLRHRAVLSELARLRPDVGVVACLPWRVPPAVLHLPRLGILNLHPALLPRHRGPDPLFWTFFEGLRESGVTVHQMTEAFDAGPILAQQRIAIPDGMSEHELEEACALAGGRLAADAIVALARELATPRPQDESRASYDPPPTFEDYRITGERSARWAFNFAAGLLARPDGIWVDAGRGGRWRILAPLAFASEHVLDAPWQIEGDILSLRCTPGVFRVRVAPLE